MATPLLSLWFGNFFEPFYSDPDATRAGIADVASLGFTTVNLDSKPWEDFFARYRGEPASPYVAMQELMIAEAVARGLDVTSLALYLNGDNLYPGIRDVPPVRGEEAIRPDGSPMGTYKYWSERAQTSMVEHVTGLLRLYGDAMHRRDDGRTVVQTMFDPIAKPSFDAEGREHYLRWLRTRYASIDEMAQAYGVDVASFDDLRPDDYWLRPDELDWVGCATPSRADIDGRTPDFRRWIDNQSYLAQVMEDHFAQMRRRWNELETPIFVEPVLHQWGYFFNPPGATDWQTGQRALDVYRLAPHVDSVLYLAAPLNAENRADATVLSVEGSILRTANSGRRFTGGLYLGRHVNLDVYDVVAPGEAIATLVAAGADGIHAYGYSGLDDGGVMSRMDDVFRSSLRGGLAWASEVIPLLDAPRSREVAVLFPAEMMLYEPGDLDEGGRHRMDLLGWCRQLTDLGWHVDVVHPDQVVDGALAGYSALVAPANSLADLSPRPGLATALRAFVQSGGTMLHGPACATAAEAFGVAESPVDFDAIRWREDVIPHGWSTVAFRTGEALARYHRSGEAALARLDVGAGTVYSFGFEYGYAYSRATMPIVPPSYGKAEMHPITLLRTTPVGAILGTAPHAVLAPIRGLEVARFGTGAVVVNHRSSPIDLGDLRTTRRLPLLPEAGERLAGHSAVYLEFAG